MIHKITAIAILAIGSLVGCGSGGGSSGTTTKTGYFIDSAVEGLEYTSGNTTGITGADGSFKYEEGKPVTFKIGNMILGSVTVTNNRVFPVDLVNGAADEQNDNVAFMAQVLQTLDTGGNVSERISINENTRRAFTQPINLSNATIDPNAPPTEISSTLATLQKTLVTPAAARSHLESNLVQEYVGNWTGTYSGNDSGTCNIDIGFFSTTPVGVVYTGGTCTSNQLTNDQGGTGRLRFMRFPSNGTFQGTLSNNALFTGQFTRKGTMTGIWTNGSYSGTWTLTKQPAPN
jgi:hypothetical protein